MFALRPKHYAHYVQPGDVVGLSRDAIHKNATLMARADVHEYMIWEEASFFKIPVLLLMLITLLNDGTLISVGYDNAIPSQRPDKWNLKVVWLVSVVLGIIACGSNLLALWLALDSINEKGIMRRMGIPALPYAKVRARASQPARQPCHLLRLLPPPWLALAPHPRPMHPPPTTTTTPPPHHHLQVTMLMYLKVSITDFLTLFSSRTVGPFYSSRPGNLLLGGATLALTLSTILACAWPIGTLDGSYVEGLALGDYRLMPLWVWIFSIVCWFIQDAIKVRAPPHSCPTAALRPPPPALDAGHAWPVLLSPARACFTPSSPPPCSRSPPRSPPTPPQVATYKLIERFNIFDANTGALVNVRAAHTFDDPRHKLARVSAGMVEGKLLQMKVRAGRAPARRGLLLPGPRACAPAQLPTAAADCRRCSRS